MAGLSLKLPRLTGAAAGQMKEAGMRAGRRRSAWRGEEREGFLTCFRELKMSLAAAPAVWSEKRMQLHYSISSGSSPD